MDLIFIITLLSGIFVADAAQKIAVPVGGKANFHCSHESMAVWTKKDKDSSNDQIIAAGTTVMAAVDKKRYSFTQKGTEFQLSIDGIVSSDAGKFICNSIHEYDLIVVENPICIPKVTVLKEDEQFRFSCQSKVVSFDRNDEEGKESGEIEWSLGKDPVYGEKDESSADDLVKSTFSYSAKYLDHGKVLACRVRHPHWDPAFPAPSCSYDKFNVQFEPKIECPAEKLFFPAKDGPEFLLKCEIVGNPLPEFKDIKWSFEKKRGVERRVFPSFVQKENSIEATLKLTKHHLSVKSSNVRVTLKVLNKLANKNNNNDNDNHNSDNNNNNDNKENNKYVTKSILARYVHGPGISCNKNIVVKPGNNNDKPLKIRCDVYVNPIPPNSNISWYVDDDFIQRQRSESSTEIANGIQVGMELDADQYGKDSLKVTLKISGLIAAQGETIHVSVPHVQNDAEDRRRGAEGGRASEAGGFFVGGNAGLMMLGAGTFFLMILTVVVAIVFYRKGFFSSSDESQYGTRAVIAQGTMADSDFFGVADKGYDTGTFQFYQPKNTLDPHGTMTMKLMKRIKESERDSEWTEGFAKMANALYLKDTDQDGYLTVMEAKPVVLSYGDIYHLGITENKLDEVFGQCSNGQHVDVETLLRMISVQ